MAARAIVGILLGILMAPVIFLMIFMFSAYFGDVFWTTFSPSFVDGVMKYASWGVASTIAPMFGAYHVSLIECLGAEGSLFGIHSSYGPGFLMWFAPALVTWGIVGAWSGAIERSPTRGIGVGIGCWLGWFIISLLLVLLNPTINMFGGALPTTQNLAGLIDPMGYGLGVTVLTEVMLAQILTAITVVVVAVIFGAITKSEEF